MVVEEIMSTQPVVVEANESIGSACVKLREADVRHLPVVDRGTLVGILSDRDLAAFDPELGAYSEARTEPAASVMSSDLVLANPETDVADAIDLMIEHKIGALPVVAADSLELIGIVSYVDVLRAARDRV